jgi:predicted esterase
MHATRVSSGMRFPRLNPRAGLAAGCFLTAAAVLAAPARYESVVFWQVVHGTADKSVPFAHSEALVAKLKAKGIRHELMAIPDAPHTPTAHTEAFVKTTSAFVFPAIKK